jgi:hypothetical protein
MQDEEWLDMKINHPSDFEMSCSEEAAMRVKDPNIFLHPSCVPLAEVDFTAQHSMFSDRGCTTGCLT